MSSIEEASLAFVERFIKRNDFAVPPGSIAMVTSSMDTSYKEMAILKNPLEDDIFQFEDDSAVVAKAMGLPHEESNVLFVTIV